MLSAIGVAFATVFLAELGDKSQLLALSLAARYRRGVLLAAVFTASAVTVGISVAVGTVAGELLPVRWLRIGAGVLFLVFAALTFLRSAEDEGELKGPRRGGFFPAVFALCAAELGDKTMVAAFALAASTSATGVWIGGTLGMAAGSALAVVVGASVWRRLKPGTVRVVSGLMFAAVGVVLLVEAIFA